MANISREPINATGSYRFDNSNLRGIGEGMNYQGRRYSLLGALSLLGLSVLLGLGCAPEPETDAEPDLPGRALTGQIVKVDLERGTLLVDHDEIPDYMPPMVMEFKVNPGDLAIAEEGERIRARLIEEPAGEFKLSHIWPDDKVASSQIASAAAALRQDTTIRGTKAYREVGENLPDFALYDQDGEVVSVHRFRGKKVLLNFIYTRCPIATMCPAAVLNMMAVQSKLEFAGRSDDLALVSISFDPEYDTPGVLREYADLRGINTEQYHFLTGPEGAIKDLLRQLGVLTEVDGPLIQHTLATLLIDENGRIIHRVDGSRWDPDDFVYRIMQ